MLIGLALFQEWHPGVQFKLLLPGGARMTDQTQVQHTQCGSKQYAQSTALGASLFLAHDFLLLI
jgi:hypothetical protein